MDVDEDEDARGRALAALSGGHAVWCEADMIIRQNVLIISSAFALRARCRCASLPRCAFCNALLGEPCGARSGETHAIGAGPCWIDDAFNDAKRLGLM